MKDNQEYILFKTIELRYSPWILYKENTNNLQENTYRS